MKGKDKQGDKRIYRIHILLAVDKTARFCAICSYCRNRFAFLVEEQFTHRGSGLGMYSRGVPVWCSWVYTA